MTQSARDYIKCKLKPILAAIKSLEASGSGDALKADPLSQFAATTSAQLRGIISDETGTGPLVFRDNPTLTDPIVANLKNSLNLSWIGSVPVADSINYLFVYPSATGDPVIIQPLGGDTNVDLLIQGNGAGSTILPKSDITSTSLKLHADAYVQLTSSRDATDADNGKILWATSAYTITFPDTLTKPFGCVLKTENDIKITTAVSGANVLVPAESGHTGTAATKGSFVTIDIRTGTDVYMFGKSS